MELQAMIIAIYARVSTADQSCEMQLRELRQYVAKRGWEVFAEYVDTGFSGAQASRPRPDHPAAVFSMSFFNDHEGNVVGLWRALSEILNGVQEALLNRV